MKLQLAELQMVASREKHNGKVKIICGKERVKVEMFLNVVSK